LIKLRINKKPHKLLLTSNNKKLRRLSFKAFIYQIILYYKK
jgi:hypothetical protein